MSKKKALSPLQIKTDGESIPAGMQPISELVVSDEGNTFAGYTAALTLKDKGMVKRMDGTTESLESDTDSVEDIRRKLNSVLTKFREATPPTSPHEPQSPGDIISLENPRHALQKSSLNNGYQTKRLHRDSSLEEELQEKVKQYSEAARTWRQKWRKEKDETIKMADEMRYFEKHCRDLVDKLSIAYEGRIINIEGKLIEALEVQDELIKESVERKDKYKSEVDRLNERNKQLRRRIATREREHTTRVTEIENLNKELTNINNKLKEENASLLEQIASSQSKQDKLKEENASLLEQIVLYQSKQDKIKEENASLLDQIASSQSKQEANEKQRTNLTNCNDFHEMLLDIAISRLRVLEEGTSISNGERIYKVPLRKKSSYVLQSKTGDPTCMDIVDLAKSTDTRFVGQKHVPFIAGESFDDNSSCKSWGTGSVTSDSASERYLTPPLTRRKRYRTSSDNVTDSVSETTDLSESVGKESSSLISDGNDQVVQLIVPEMCEATEEIVQGKYDECEVLDTPKFINVRNPWPVAENIATSMPDLQMEDVDSVNSRQEMAAPKGEPYSPRRQTMGDAGGYRNKKKELRRASSQNSRPSSAEISSTTSSNENLAGTRSSGFEALRERRNGIAAVPMDIALQLKPKKQKGKDFMDIFRKFGGKDQTHDEEKKLRKRSRSLRKD